MLLRITLVTLVLVRAPSVTLVLVRAPSVTLVLVRAPSVTLVLVRAPSVTLVLVRAPSVTLVLVTSGSVTISRHGKVRGLRYYVHDHANVLLDTAHPGTCVTPGHKLSTMCRTHVQLSTDIGDTLLTQ